MEVSALVLGLILYGLLPLWVIAGFVDWWCHRRTRIEDTSGLRESLMHITMGIQVALPLWLALACKINVLILLLSFVVLITHEIVAHYDVKWTTDKREISIWETHAHSFLETVPFFIVALMLCLNWDVLTKLVTLDWSNSLGLHLRQAPIGEEIGSPIGSSVFIRNYFVLVVFLGILPYAEEVIRCGRAAWRREFGEE